MEPAPPPPALRATLAVLLQGEAPPLEELRARGPGVEGVDWLASWPGEGLALLRIPLLLPGARLRELLGSALGGTAVAREVRELRLLIDAAREALRDERGGAGGSRGPALMALADALQPLPAATTMLEVQARLRSALRGGAEVISLSHYDALILPGDLEPSSIQAAIARAYASLTSRPVPVALKPLASLEALLTRLPPR